MKILNILRPARSGDLLPLAIVAIFLSGLPGLAQQPIPRAPADKKPCDVLTKAEAESILGVAVMPHGSSPYYCDYVETGWTNKPPKNKRVQLSATLYTVAYRDAAADTWKNMADNPMPTRTAKDLPGFADAAIWAWYQDHGGELSAFKGGTLYVDVLLTGFAEEVTLPRAKALAEKILGGNTGTGYAYNAPAIAPRMDKPPVASADAMPKAKPQPASNAAPAVAGGATFSQAVPITASQFFQEVKTVSLTINVSPLITKYVPAAEIQKYLTDLLAFHKVSVQAGAEVALQLTLDDFPSAFVTTTTTTDQFGTRQSGKENFHTHSIAAVLSFFVRTAVWRNGVFHPMEIAPVSTLYFNDLPEPREARKIVYGDETPGEMRQLLTGLLTQEFDDVASSKTTDDVPWAVSGWTEQAKVAANAAFVKAMNAPLETHPAAGLTSTPKIELNPHLSDACKADPTWHDFWEAEFQREGWVKPQPGATLSHFYDCRWMPLLGFPGYYRLQDVVTLYESNVVFQLQGKYFRKRAELFSTHRIVTAMDEQLAGAEQGFLPRSILEFSTNLTLGKRTVPTIVAAH